MKCDEDLRGWEEDDPIVVDIDCWPAKSLMCEHPHVYIHYFSMNKIYIAITL